MNLIIKEEIYPYYNYLPIKEAKKELRRVKISNIQGLSRKDVTSESYKVKELVKKLKKQGEIDFPTHDIGLIKINKHYFVGHDGNHRILAIKLCENKIKNKFIISRVTELSIKKTDITKAKEALLEYLLKKATQHRYYCRNCNSNFAEKILKK